MLVRVLPFWGEGYFLGVDVDFVRRVKMGCVLLDHARALHMPRHVFFVLLVHPSLHHLLNMVLLLLEVGPASTLLTMEALVVLVRHFLSWRRGSMHLVTLLYLLCVVVVHSVDLQVEEVLLPKY